MIAWLILLTHSWVALHWVQHAQAAFRIRPSVVRPSGPTNVALYVVSPTELGVKWDPPKFSGGLPIGKYLVEWDTVRGMDSSAASPANPYTNLLDGPLVSSEVVTDTQYQITGLDEGTMYFVRVSAYNDAGYSNAISTTPASAVTSSVLPYLPTSVTISVSASQVPNRLDLAWSLPTVNKEGFVTDLADCGAAGHTPDRATSYHIRWDTHPSMATATSYEVDMVEGDDIPLPCCSDDGCSVQIGAEVQTITVNSTMNGALSSGSFKVVYVGDQNPAISVVPTHGSSSLTVSGTPSITPGDFVRVDGDVYLVISVALPVVTLSTEYLGAKSGEEQVAHYGSPPASCFDVATKSSAEDLRAHILQNFDDSPFEEDVTVSRRSFSSLDGHGFSYHVTFTGPAFMDNTDELFIVSNHSPWMDLSCGDPFVVEGKDVSHRVLLNVKTEINSGSLIPGRPYYVQIAATNKVGEGPFAAASPDVEVPRAPPGLAQDCKVYAVPTSSESLKVEWDGVAPDHGEDPHLYKVEFYNEGALIATHMVEEIDEASRYSITKDGLTPGLYYEVAVVPINNQGEGAPVWYADVDSSDGSLLGRYHDYRMKSCYAVPTCEVSSEECSEGGGLLIMARSTPSPPQFTVATYPEVSGPNRFSRDSLLVTFSAPPADALSGDPVDKFRVEWSMNPKFVGAASFETSNNGYLITSLDMGTVYYVRVTAHNSAGYGPPANDVPAKPMQSPDPPFAPTLSILSTNSHDPDEVGTSLAVEWNAPKVDNEDGRPDMVGNGGDGVTGYLIEWSKVAWDIFVPSVWEISIRDSANVGTSVEGSFRLTLDTTSLATVAVPSRQVSSSILVDASTNELKTILQNMPNIGEVLVTSPTPKTWRVTFQSEVGNIVGFSVDENAVTDQGGGAAALVSLTQIDLGSVPSNSAYSFAVVEDLDQKPALKYTIENIVPGQQYFVRVSSRNRLGYSGRRLTAPAALAPPVQKPGPPVSLFHDGAPPFLSSHSDTSLTVYIGPPQYDGGAPLTYFVIEWDVSPSFDSSPSGSALGSARTSAMKSPSLCSQCVTSFDADTHTFTYNGNSITEKQLLAQRKIMVYFSDDNTAYLFEIVSASANHITVSSLHLRAASLHAMVSRGGFIGGSDLDLLGAEYRISGLEAGRRYHVRVFAENGEMGTGLPILTSPSSEVPRSFPHPPREATLSIVDKHTLQVDWTDSFAENSDITSYSVEYFTKSSAVSSSFSFFGSQEVIEFDSVGLGLTGGSFSLLFGETTVQLPGTVEAVSGRDYVDTTTDLAPFLARGDGIIISGLSFTVHEWKEISPTRIPLSSAFSGITESAAKIFARSKSAQIPFDATAQELTAVLENMPLVGRVDVRRDVGVPDGFRWTVTFLSNMGPQPPFFVDTTLLVGINPSGFRASEVLSGQNPDNYASIVVSNPSVTSAKLSNLDTGRDYYVHVRSTSDRGDSLPVNTVPLYAAPGQIPGVPKPPSVKPFTEGSILVVYEEAAASNGAPITEYVIEVDTSSSFADSVIITKAVDHRVQRITTSAHSTPWDPSSTFTLSLGDYHGDYNTVVGSGTLVRVDSGSSIAERVTGSDDLSSLVTRGDFVLIGGQEFRICLVDGNGLMYDESHLPLCSKEDAWSTAAYELQEHGGSIDRAPIFVLDTSLGSVKSPAMGDKTLNTVDVSGSPNDTTGRLRRGDLIRVGDPDQGEIFRVSTDTTREFTEAVVPLGLKEDASITASLAMETLAFATYEAQSFSLVAKEASVALTGSNVMNSGFRIRFGPETTHTTTSGGAEGCLRWDGDAAEMKEELETLLGIDAVKVTKEIITYEAGVTGAGVRYHVTFTGANVRGNVRPVQIIDIGENGCLDAHKSGGQFSQDIGPIVVMQESIPYIPFYKVQTSTDIPFDAAATDVKAAVEALTQACKVDVSRQIHRHGYSWDVTFTAQRDESCSSYTPLLAMSANGLGLDAAVDPSISVVDLQEVEVPAIKNGIPHFVRLAARNSFGVGPYTLSNPSSVEPSAQTPGEPRKVFAEPLSDTEILVQWEGPVENGGSPITHYKVEYDDSLSFNGGVNRSPLGSVIVSADNLSSIMDIQSITVKIDTDGLINPPQYYLSGTFSVTFDGQTTGQLPYNVSPEAMEKALKQLCTVSDVSVSRSIHCSADDRSGCMDPQGYTWLVTYMSPGDQHDRYTSTLNAGRSHKLSVDSSYLYECTDLGLSACFHNGYAVASVGSVQETQQITTGSSSFTVTMGSQTSALISITDTIFDVEAKINEIDGAGHVIVSCMSCSGDHIGPGETIFLTFLSHRGDVPSIVVSDPSATVSEVIKGSAQPVVGRSTYSTLIQDLSSVKDWYFRVFGYNGVGGGRPSNAWPEGIRPYIVPPSVPRNVFINVAGSTSLTVSWDSPMSDGGNAVSEFIVEYDTSPAFATQSGSPLGRQAIPESAVDTSVGLVSLAYPNDEDVNLRQRLFVDSADLVTEETIRVGSTLLVGGHELSVAAIDEEGCGMTCITVDKEFSGDVGSRIYLGFDAREYSFDITGLTPGVNYFVRVAAVSSDAVGPSAYFGYPYIPLSRAPMDVPEVVAWAELSAVSQHELRVDFGRPLNEKPEGSNGSPVSSFVVEVATGDYEVQRLSLMSPDEPLEGEFRLTLGSDETSCIAVGSSAVDLEMALEDLPGVDGVTVSLLDQGVTSSIYEIVFDGPVFSNGDQEMMGVGQSDCAVISPATAFHNIDVVRDGVASFVPEVVSVTASADDSVSGYMELSVDFVGEYTQLVSINGNAMQFRVDAGSRFVSTLGQDLSSVVMNGERLMIGSELVEVVSIAVDSLILATYHTRGTGGNAVPGFRMDNFVGIGTVLTSDNRITDSTGRDLKTLVDEGDLVQIINDLGREEYFTVTSVVGSIVYLSSTYHGATVTTPLHIRKKVLIPIDASSLDMKQNLESLPGVGSVDVTRLGPNPTNGYTWIVTFTSHMGPSGCPSHARCLQVKTASVRAVNVTNLSTDLDGTYVLTAFTDGRPRYEMLGTSSRILYDASGEHWGIYDSSSTLVSDQSSASIYPPTSGWSAGAELLAVNSPVNLLSGSVDVTVVQAGAVPSFEKVVFSARTNDSLPEIQVVEVSVDSDDLGGSFELSFRDDTRRVRMSCDESAIDFEAKLEHLPTVGNIHVERQVGANGLGYAWSVTFQSDTDALELIKQHGTADLYGTGVGLEVREWKKGNSINQRVVASGLSSGQTYVARVAALNEAGVGDFTTVKQNGGLGVLPLSKTSAAVPGRPNMTVDMISDSQVNIRFAPPQDHGSPIELYKVEWTTGSSFGVPNEITVKISCDVANDMLGTFRVVYGKDEALYPERTVPIKVRASAEEVAAALDDLSLLGGVSVVKTNDNEFEVEWLVTFIQDVGSLGSVAVDAGGLRSESGQSSITAAVTPVTIGSLPENYGFDYMFTDASTCGSTYVGESSAVQYVTLSAEHGSAPVSAGSYKLALDMETTTCIPHDASASAVEMALLDLNNVNNVFVTSQPARPGSGFPYEYRITFEDDYKYGEWPVLRVPTNTFGSEECEPFVGGTNHRAFVLPAREEDACGSGIPGTAVIAIDSLSPVGGAFDLHYGDRSHLSINVAASENEMKVAIQSLVGLADVDVSKFRHGDMDHGVAWVVSFPSSECNLLEKLVVKDNLVTGKNAKVNVYPMLNITTFSVQNDISGDFRIHLGDEVTAPISHRATEGKLLEELHQLIGVGKAMMLGPRHPDGALSAVELEALVDESLVVSSRKAVAVVGDVTTVLARGDAFNVGNCSELIVEAVSHEDFNEAVGAGHLFHTKYPSSPGTITAKKLGYTTLVVSSPVGASFSFSDDCLQTDTIGATVQVGSTVKVSHGVERNIVMKAFTADLESLRVVPETNWRGTGSRIFATRPAGQVPNTFNLDRLGGVGHTFRVSARNSEGYGLPSHPVTTTPVASVPGPPLSVLLGYF